MSIDLYLNYFIVASSRNLSKKNIFNTIIRNCLELLLTDTENPEAATGGVLLKKVYLKILQTSQENICARDSFLIKLQTSNTSGKLNFKTHFCIYMLF